MKIVSSLSHVISVLCLCGLAGTSARAGVLDAPVVGGSVVTDRKAYPDVVAVFGEDGSLCSGTLIAADLVLTAGHCIGGKPYEVLVGSVDAQRADGDWRAVKWSKAYPDWEHTYDVGIVMLEHPVAVKARAFAEHCQTGKRDRLVPGASVFVGGFGLITETATDRNTRLHVARLSIVDGTCMDRTSCNAAVAPGGELIAGGDGHDACFGDSGGPVWIATASESRALLGVVSRGLATWGNPCGEGGVFVRAERVIAWIEKASGRVIERVECDLPRADDGGGDPDDEGAGCRATDGVVGLGLTLGYAAVCVVVMWAGRMRRRKRDRRSAP